METKEAAEGIHPAPELERLAAHVERGLDDLVTEIVTAYDGRVAAFTDPDPGTVRELRARAHDIVNGGLAVFRGEIAPSALAAQLTQLGRDRAADGISLSDVLLAFHLAARTTWQRLVREAARYPEAEAKLVVAATTALLDVVETGVTCISSAYVDVAERRVADAEHDIQLLVEALAGVRPADASHEERMARHGVDASALRWCIVSRPPAGEVGERMRAVRRELDDALVGRIEDHVVVYTSAEDVPEVKRFERSGYALATDPGTGYRRARAALRVADHLKRDAVRYAEVVPLALLLDAPAAEREAFVQFKLGPVIEQPRADELLDSLAAYYANGQSTAAAARELHVHRHTLEYRLQRIRTLLNVELADPHARLLLELALNLYRA